MNDGNKRKRGHSKHEFSVVLDSEKLHEKTTITAHKPDLVESRLSGASDQRLRVSFLPNNEICFQSMLLWSGLNTPRLYILTKPLLTGPLTRTISRSLVITNFHFCAIVFDLKSNAPEVSC